MEKLFCFNEKFVNLVSCPRDLSLLSLGLCKALNLTTNLEIRKICRLEPGLMLQLHGAIYRPDSFVLMLRYCANLKAIRYESTSFNRIVADKSHRVIVA